MSPSVSSTQIKTLLALVAVYARNGRATVREVAAARGMSLNAVHEHLFVLRSAGFVEWRDGTQGTLRPTVGVAR